MAENNPMDFISKILSNPEAVNKMSALLQPKTAETEEHLSLPDTKMPSFSVQDEDNSARLLHALEPFLSNRRRGRIPQMMQVMQIGRMLGGLHKK